MANRARRQDAEIKWLDLEVIEFRDDANASFHQCTDSAALDLTI